MTDPCPPGLFGGRRAPSQAPTEAAASGILRVLKGQGSSHESLWLDDQLPPLQPHFRCYLAAPRVGGPVEVGREPRIGDGLDVAGVAHLL